MPDKVFDQVFQTRIGTSLVYVICWVVSIFISPWLFLFALSIALIICNVEFFRLAKTRQPLVYLAIGWTAMAFLVYDQLQPAPITDHLPEILCLIALAGGLGHLFFPRFTEKNWPIKNFYHYASVGIMAFALIPFEEGIASYSPVIPFTLLILIWANDSYAYIFGKKWGKKPLWITLSPKKTVEGTLGGATGTFVTAYLASLVFSNLSLRQALLAAFIVSIFAPLGDLFESKVKRSAGVKDSGKWLPGHGGLLDRLDSLLFAAPAYYLAQQYLYS